MSMNSLSVLIVEDNQKIAIQLGEFLEGHNWTIDYANTGKRAIRLIDQFIFDVIILDLGLPDIDGLEVCRYIKNNSQRNAPVLMLTARDAYHDLAKGFKEGTDDYLTKPYDLREVALRCQALAKRHILHENNIVTLGQLQINVRDKSVYVNEDQLKTTNIGFKIINVLVKNYPDAVTRSEIIHNIWGDSPPESNSLKAHMYALRQLVKDVSEVHIETLSGVGYRLVINNV